MVWRLSYIVFILPASRLANGLEIATLLSALAGATVKPSADATPAAGGIITRLIPSLFATAQAWTGAAPPVA